MSATVIKSMAAIGDALLDNNKQHQPHNTGNNNNNNNNTTINNTITDTSATAAATVQPPEDAHTMCVCCLVKKRSTNSTTCSKRCEWVVQGRCPQCGRSRRTDMPFCGKACASHSVHANWCPTCTVNQCAAGRQHCSEACALQSVRIVDRPRRKADSDNNNHVLLHADDREYATVTHLVKGLQVAGIIRLAHHQTRRRQYLNYRAAIEHRMSQVGQLKYGHGGEGNEHKRFTPVSHTCTMLHNYLNNNSNSNNNNNINNNNDGIITPCPDPGCQACQILRYGYSLQHANMLSHYCMASSDVAASWAPPHPISGLRAVVVARAVVGNPQLIQSSDEINQPWLEGYDSCIVTNGNPAFDGTYLFCDDAIEALYIVLCA